MSYIAATYLDKDSWPKFGINWMRKAKSVGLTGFVIGEELPEESHQKTKDLGFEIVPLEKKFGDDRDRYHALVGALKGRRCLFTRPEIDPRGGQ